MRIQPARNQKERHEMFDLENEVDQLLSDWINDTYYDLEMENVPVREFADQAKAAVDKAVMDYMADAIYRLQHPTK